jgi:hypothetical protein
VLSCRYLTIEPDSCAGAICMLSQIAMCYLDAI